MHWVRLLLQIVIKGYKMTPTEIKEYRNRMEALVIENYKLNDAGHQIDHAESVCDLGLAINTKLQLGLSERNIITAAYMHDIFANMNDKQQRSKHQELSYLAVLDTKWIDNTFIDNDDDIINVALACREHRASFRGEYSSLLSELIASADRGFPNFRAYLKRGLLHHGVDNLDDAIDHLKKKYGRDGYAKYPELYAKYFKDELYELHDILDTV